MGVWGVAPGVIGQPKNKEKRTKKENFTFTIMSEQQKIIFEGACTLMAGLMKAGLVSYCNDSQRDHCNKYCIEKAMKIYHDILNNKK